MPTYNDMSGHRDVFIYQEMTVQAKGKRFSICENHVLLQNVSFFINKIHFTLMSMFVKVKVDVEVQIDLANSSLQIYAINELCTNMP